MACPNCTSGAMLVSSSTQRFALVWNSGALGAPVRNFGSFENSGFVPRPQPNAVSKGFEQEVGCRLSGSSSSSSAGGLARQLPRARIRSGNSESERSFISLTLREEFIVRANASRRNFLLMQLGDDGGYEEGPIELPPAEFEIDPLAFPEANPFQIVASFVLTGTIGILLLRSLRRRAQRAKETKFRSGRVSTSESIKEDARKAAIAKLTQAPEVPVAPPSPGQTFLGAAVAGVIALLLYKFTTTVEGSFAGKAVSMNYSIRNLTITVRTIINGLLYLATFVFAANSIGLALYSLQLLLGGNPSPDPPRAEPLEKRESSSDSEKSSEAEDKN